jgi:hypothetical protein
LRVGHLPERTGVLLGSLRPGNLRFSRAERALIIWQLTAALGAARSVLPSGVVSVDLGGLFEPSL